MPFAGSISSGSCCFRLAVVFFTVPAAVNAIQTFGEFLNSKPHCRTLGLNVYCGPWIVPWQAPSMENLVCTIIRASFSQKRVICQR